MTKAQERNLIKLIKQQDQYDIEYLQIFTKWVQEWFNLNTFPPFLFREKGVLCEVGCGNCLRCLIKYQIFENLSEISYDISVRTKTIFPVTILQNLINSSKKVFIKIEEDE